MTTLGPLPALDHVLRIVLSGSISTKPWNSVQHAQYQGPAIDVNTANGLCTSIGTAWANAIAPVSCSNVVLSEVTVTDLTSSTSAQGAQNVSHTGTQTGTSTFPTSACWVQSLTTVFRYRGGHPRIYWPYTSSAALINNSTFGSTTLGVLGTAATGWISDINNLLVNSIGLKHGCAFYYTHDPVTKARIYRTPPFFQPTIATAVHQRVDTQRRRLGSEVP